MVGPLKPRPDLDWIKQVVEKLDHLREDGGFDELVSRIYRSILNPSDRTTSIPIDSLGRLERAQRATAAIAAEPTWWAASSLVCDGARYIVTDTHGGVWIASPRAVRTDGMQFRASAVLESPKGEWIRAFGPQALDKTRATCLQTYWAVTPNIAEHWARDAFRALSSAGIPFELKLATRTESFARPNVATLYTRLEDTPLVEFPVARLYAQFARQLKPHQPILAKPIYRGVSAAVRPKGNASFGSHRARLIAEALVSARDSASHAQIIRAIRDRFSKERIDIETPYESLDESLPLGGTPLVT